MRGVYLAALLLVLGCLPLSAQSQPDPLEQDRAMIAQAEHEHGPESRELADALVAFMAHAQSEELVNPEVMRMAEYAVVVTQNAYGSDSGPHAVALAHQSVLEGVRGDFVSSQDLAAEALAIARRLAPPDPAAVLEAAEAAGNVRILIGDYTGALAAFQEAADALRSEAQPDLGELATILSNRALVYARLRRYDEAVADLREAYSATEKRYGRESEQFAIITNNLGTSLLQNDHPVEAIPYLDQALTASVKVFGPDTIQVATALSNLGDTLALTGQFERSWTLLRQADELYRRLLSPEHPDVANNLVALAHSLAAGGELAKALDVSLAAERIGRMHFLVTAAALPERQALAYARTRPHGLDVALSVEAAEPGISAGAVYEEVMRSRALVADGLAWRNQEIARSQDAGVKALSQELVERRTRLAQLANSPNPSDPAYAGKLSQARADFEETERTLAAHSAAFQQEQQERSVTLAQILEALPEGGVLVSYVRYRQWPVRRVESKKNSTASYAAFVQGKGAPLRFVSLGPAQPIDELVASLRELIDKEASAPGIASRGSEQQYRETGEKLRRAIWDPLGPFDKAKLILEVPDGMLQFVNLAALPAENDHYLIERSAPIHRLTAERDLLASADQRPPAGLLGVGGADFGPGPATGKATRGATKLSCEDISKVRFSPLPETLPELREVAGLYHEGAPSAPVVELTGKAASKSEFIAKAESQGVLHLATHAYFIPVACAQGQPGAQHGPPVPAYENPLLRSGLVFSGPATDSVLTAQEISGLSLTGTRWAVLSACDSGMGELQDGEGVLGLQRAFRVAGARTVIMSLWPVDDDSTRRFMRNLYRQRFRQHLSTADAMHRATVQTLAQMRAEKHGTHPFYWAGFVASGDWR